MLKYNGKLIERAKTLRKDMTPSERKLWYLFLSKQKARFQRQKTIGDYIVDFYCYEFNLVVELDGSQHYEDDVVEYDTIRTGYLEGLGLQVIRFANTDVLDYFESVCGVIENLITPPVTS